MIAVPPKTIRLEYVQILRAVAALLVCSGHIFNEMDVISGAQWAKEISLRFPQFRLDLLFIISGFLTFYTSHKLFNSGSNWRKFITRRAIRIIPMYWFFTSLILLIAIILPQQLDSTKFTPGHAIFSYLFIPHFNPAVPTSIHPALGLGWTLIYEVFFVIIFTLALSLSLSARRALIFVSLIFLLFYVLGVSGMLGNTAWNTFFSSSIPFEFVIGGALSFLIRDGKLSWKFALFITITCLILYTFAKHTALGIDLRALERGTLALIMLIAFSQFYRAVPILTPTLTKIADASYTLYLSHPFTLTAIKIATFKMLPVNTTSLWVYFVFAFLASIAFSLLFYRHVEKPVINFLTKLNEKRRAA